MAIRFVIDSGSDILPVEAEKKDMVHVPLTVSFEGQEYLDAVELGHEEFYDKLESCENLPVTSQVPPYRFEEVFEKVVSEGDYCNHHFRCTFRYSSECVYCCSGISRKSLCCGQ